MRSVLWITRSCIVEGGDSSLLLTVDVWAESLKDVILVICPASEQVIVHAFCVYQRCMTVTERLDGQGPSDT